MPKLGGGPKSRVNQNTARLSGRVARRVTGRGPVNVNDVQNLLTHLHNAVLETAAEACRGGAGEGPSRHANSDQGHEVRAEPMGN